LEAWLATDPYRLKIYLNFHFDQPNEDEIDEMIEEIDSFIKGLFEALVPLFQFNSNLQFFDLVVVGWGSDVLASGVNDMILASQSLKSIRLHCNMNMDWKILTGPTLVANRQMQHLSLTGGALSREACVDIQNSLSQEQCGLQSLTRRLRELSVAYQAASQSSVRV
jgi:hypothetical protein